MVDDRQGRHSSSFGDAIEPVDFSPPPPPERQWRFRLRAWHLLSAGFLLLATAAAWFVLTAKSVYVQVEPLTAEINIEGGTAIRIGERYLMRSGDYRVRLQETGYFDLEALLEVGEPAAQTHSFELEPRPGIITISSLDQNGSPLRGIRVRIDGVDAGTTPLEDLSLAPGDYEISLLGERYLTQTQNLSVAGRLQEQSLKMHLDPAWAEVSFTTQPSGAEVIVNGEELGVTPLRAELLQGANDVTLKLPGYKAWQDDLVIRAGEHLDLPPIELEASDGLVFIRSTPGNANVTINGEFRGQTPLEVALAPDQEHEISLFRTGFRTTVRRLQTRPDEERDLTIPLDPVTTPVRVLADPPDAQLYVDGELVGPADQTVDLLAASQRIEIRKDGYVPYISNFTSRPGLDQEIRVSLKTEEEARLEAIEPEITTVAGQVLKLFYPHEFTMGASRREPGRRANEPLRDIIMEKPFYISLRPITNAQYRRFDDEHMSGSVQGQTLDRPNQPVVSVTWLDAARYSNWLSEQENLTPFYIIDGDEVTGINADSTGYRLPTEAEWEWVARTDGDGNIQRYAWGEQWPPPEGSGNFADVSTRNFLGQYLRDYDDGHVATSNVGSFPANANGIYDLAGNVSEWVHDYYGAVSGLSSAREIDPIGPDDGRYRTVKGSSWMHGSMTELRFSYRDFAEEPRNDLGFRVARYLGGIGND